jgi:glycosyltransferase 2 family protein
VDAGVRRRLVIAAQAVLLAAVAFFVWRSLASGLSSSGFLHLRFSLPYLLASWVALLGYYAMYTGGMDIILRLLGAPSSFARVFKLNFSTNLGKYLPGGIWPVFGRMTLGPKLGLPRRVVAPGMVLEAGLSVAGGLLVFFASLAFGGGGLPGGTAAWQWIALAAIVVVATAPPVFRRALAFGFRLAKVDEPVPRLSYVATLGLTAFYAVSWLVAGLAFKLYTLALVADAPGSILRYAGVYAAASITGLVVLFAPGGIGVREAVIALLLTPLVGGPAATVVGFSARVWSTLVELTSSAVAIALPVKAAEGGAGAADGGPDDGAGGVPSRKDSSR